MKKKAVTNPTLKTWIALNDAMRTADEDQCRALLAEELKGRKRRMFCLRIHSRINRLRANRERQELL
jgi:hypothetical protein